MIVKIKNNYPLLFWSLIGFIIMIPISIILNFTISVETTVHYVSLPAACTLTISAFYGMFVNSNKKDGK